MGKPSIEVDPRADSSTSICHSDVPRLAPCSDSAGWMSLLLGLFAASGCASLIYEIVWFHLLELVVGSSAVSLGVLLGAFMGGLCLGSLLLPRIFSPARHPLRLWALLELGIGFCGLLLLIGIPRVTHLYAATAAHGALGIAWRSILCAACLLPPTIMMGATFPAISRCTQTTAGGVAWQGCLYGGNIAGAVLGSLLAGFYLLRVHDVATATWVAAVLNGSIAAIAYLFSVGWTVRPIGTVALAQPGEPAGTGLVDVTIALSGLCALGAQVVWTRSLSLILGGTVYTFSIILAVFLFGLGIGSSAASYLSRGLLRPRLALGWCQALLIGAIAWTAFMLDKSLPYWPVDASLSAGPWFKFQLDLVRCLWAVLPATILWGASFPLALAAANTSGQDPARVAGRIYAANTLGAILGALTCGLLLIGWIGTQNTQRLLIGLSALAALLMFLPSRDRHPGAAGCHSRKPGSAINLLNLFLALGGTSAFLALNLPRLPWELAAYGCRLAVRSDRGMPLYLGEGLNATVAVTELNGVRRFHVSGKIEASTDPRDMRLQRMLGHIPAMFHSQPRSVLVVGCGAGVTAGSFVVHPNIERIVICEIEPLIPKSVTAYFREENHNVLNDSRVIVACDDARHFILTTREKFDIITSDPIHPWVKGAAALYTKEYFECCKQHLNPGGLVTQWVPLYDSNPAAVKSEIATFFEVFPNGTIWSNDDHGDGYDVVLLGQIAPVQIDLDDLERRLQQPRYAPVRESLAEVGFQTGLDLLATCAGCAADLAPWLNGAQINRDCNLRLQYLAGFDPNRTPPEKIFSEMTHYCRFPERLLVGSNHLGFFRP